MSLVAMKREELDTLRRLGWACMEPTFQLIRGQSPSIKSEMISTLTDGQRALCMFRVMFDHSSNSAGEYYAWISYMQELPGYWLRRSNASDHSTESYWISIFVDKSMRFGMRLTDTNFVYISDLYKKDKYSSGSFEITSDFDVEFITSLFK